MPAVDPRSRPRPDAPDERTAGTTAVSATVIMDPVGPRRTTDPWDEPLFTSAAARQRAQRAGLRGAAAWLVPAAVMALLGGLGISWPALWTDEFATWGMAGAPWSQFWPVLRWVDAVLAPYYVLMHLWSTVAGTSDLALRLPSLAAMVGTAALVGWLGARLGSPRQGLAAGLVFAVLPASTRFAQEARPYALTAFFAVLATCLLVVALDRRARWWFVAYALAVAALGALHVVAVLLLVGHAWLVFAWRRPLAWWWGASAALGLLPLVPVLWLGSKQRGQVSYIPRVGLESITPTAAALFGSLAVAIAIVVLAAFALPLRWPSALYSAWAVVPVAALVAVSLVVPMLLPRYLVFTLPAWALLAGFAAARIPGRWAIAAVIAVVALLGLPAQLDIRRGDGHDEATREMASIIATQERPGDVAVYAANEARGGWTTRDLVAHYVPADRRPGDPLMTRPPRTDGDLLAGECQDVARCLGTPQRVWVVRMGELSDPLRGLGSGKETALRGRYHVAKVWRLRNTTLALMVA
jgi:mannosyltransferase